MFRDGGDKDYYAILQVHPRAEPEVIEAAYRRLSRKYHPDVSGEAGSGQRMRDLNEAFEVLGDPARRRAYDRQRSFRGRPATAPAQKGLEGLLRALPLYIGIAILVVLGARLLPLLLRPQILAPLAIIIVLYLLSHRLRRR
ncbi:MAG TPA: DnaJ domain-containing protein [Candidatus Acidoferrum sp.]|nr:DnaJ domain-containing protein [Candidatus Methylomirabilis sp.]HWU37403.1 DnaJ domain-containing protein [Candidatus Acidoferrum sp.]